MFGLEPNHTITEIRDQNIIDICVVGVCHWLFPCFILPIFLFLLLYLFLWFRIYFAAMSQLIGSLIVHITCMCQFLHHAFFFTSAKNKIFHLLFPIKIPLICAIETIRSHTFLAHHKRFILREPALDSYPCIMLWMCPPVGFTSI